LNKARILKKDREEARQRQAARKSGPSVQERRDELASFYDRYESLVEVLCDAAQYGPTPRLQKDYSELRGWMLGSYPPLRPFLRAFLRDEPDEKGDAFLALADSESLDTLLREDDGGMISRITRTREALNLYGEHLRQLASKAA